MPEVDIDPVRLRGPWNEGWAIERRHTISASFRGYGPTGNPHFQTKRSALGELIYRLKSRSDKTAVEHVADTATGFLWKFGLPFDLIVPMPPSRQRSFQPVVAIAEALGQRMSKPVRADAVLKIRSTPELKNVFDFDKRKELLKDAFEVNRTIVAGRLVLLVDDLYRSGATSEVVTEALLLGGAKTVAFVAMTRTRTRL